jgi:hypothetical protein
MDKELVPYFKLWAEVMNMAINDCVAALRRGYSQRNASIEWLMSDNNAPGHFIWLCYLFNLDPTATRDYIIKKGKDNG